MTTFLMVLSGVAFVSLPIILGARPHNSPYSNYELNRRIKEGDESARFLLRRRRSIGGFLSLQMILVVMLVVALGIIGAELFHWTLGLVGVFFVVFISSAVAKTKLVRKISQKIYDKNELKILNFLEKHAPLLRAVSLVGGIQSGEYKLGSKDELGAIIEKSNDVLSDDQRNLIVGGLDFGRRQVREIMTPRSEIKFVKNDDILGPLVLDELYRTGHSTFLVIGDDLDHVMGILHLQNLLSVDQKTSSGLASEAMDEKVFYVREDQTIQQAMTALLDTHQRLLVVVNRHEKTVGVLSLKDAIEAIFGREITDDFDSHDNLQKVAKRTLKESTSHD